MRERLGCCIRGAARCGAAHGLVLAIHGQTAFLCFRATSKGSFDGEGPGQVVESADLRTVGQACSAS